MTNQITGHALDIFGIYRKSKPAPKLRTYLVTWPCGSTWQIDRYDFEVPEFENGEQNGITHCFESLKDARESLPSYDCTVELIK